MRELNTTWNLSRPLLALFAVVMLSCASVHEPAAANASNPVTTPASQDAEWYCDNLNRMKNMPYHQSLASDDAIYNGLMNAGKAAVPCLIEKITDIEEMKDPRSAPSFKDFRVGDAAVFMLLFITNENWKPESMFPPKYAELWKTEGVYSYYSYVEDPKNRREIQIWWENWAKENGIHDA